MSNKITKKVLCVKDFVSTVLLIDDQLIYSEPEPTPLVDGKTLVIPQQGVVQPYVENDALKFPSPDDSKRKVYVS